MNTPETLTKERTPDGRYLVIGYARSWRVMEQFGSYRMLKKAFRTQAAAMEQAVKLP